MIKRAGGRFCDSLARFDIRGSTAQPVQTRG